MNDQEWDSWLDAHSVKRSCPEGCEEREHWRALLRRSEAAARELADQVRTLSISLEVERDRYRSPALMFIAGVIVGTIACYSVLR